MSLSEMKNKSLSKSDVCNDICSNNSTNANENETEVKKETQEAEITSDYGISYERLIFNDMSSKDLNEMSLQENINKLEVENDTLEVKTFATPSNSVSYNEFDAFASENVIYRKYKLRQRKSTKLSEEQRVDLGLNSNKKSPRIKLEEECICPYCFINFKSKNRYTAHVSLHEKRTSFICSQCSAVFMSNTELISHKETHTENMNVYCCEPCKLAFSEYCDFLKHKATHGKKKQYKCPECDYVSVRKYYIEIHIETHFNRKVKCDICSKMIKSNKLQKHLREHTMNFQCGECGKQLNNQSSYSYHISTHTGVKSYQCLYCGKGFLNNGSRRVHTRIHTGEKLYECSVCFEKFRQTTDLKRHMITHEPDKKHECNICHKSFYGKEYLERIHMKKHLNKLEYKCNLCERCFQNNAGLKSHVLYVHTKERPFKCKLCNMNFVNKGQYNRHCHSQRHKNR